MGAFATAGQDPIFWLHHCNIHRLWEKWLAQGGGRVNPIGDPTWMNTNFTFADENGNLVQMSGDEILYTVNQLNYQYEDPRTCVPPWWYYLLASEKVFLAARRTRVLASLVLARNVKPTPDQANRSSGRTRRYPRTIGQGDFSRHGIKGRGRAERATR